MGRWAAITSERARRWWELAFVTLISYVPFLLSSPGRVSGDNRQALLVDPSAFLAGAAQPWDPGFGGGTVTHQHLGYLWPTGPWFWLFDAIGAPTWVAQRLWLGTLTLVALLGARWLLRSLGVGRATALAAACVYALSPYQLAFSARMSVLLLPWAGLPWLVELTRRAVDRGGWRHPALFALVFATAVGVNATSMALVLLAPLVVLVQRVTDEGGVARVLGTAGRIGLLVTGISAWWVTGLWVQGSYGMPVLQVTESVVEVASASTPNDVLRGLGNWFFSGRDALGYSIDQAEPYLDGRLGLLASLLVPCLALASAAIAAGRTGRVAVWFVLAATVVAVGAWPYESPSAYGTAFRWFAEETSVGLALRNTPRVVPVLLLGMAILIALAVERLPRPDARLGAAAVVGAAAVIGLVPALGQGLLAEHIDRPEALPAQWIDLAAHLDDDVDGDIAARVLELPGSPFAAHRWGNVVDPLLPTLTDRPTIVREVLPYGSPATANLLDALDRRLQEGVLEPTAIAPVARLLAADHVVVRSDLQYERFGVPAPPDVWRTILDPGADLGPAVGFGPVDHEQPNRRLRPLSAHNLWSGADRGDGDVPQVSAHPLDDPQPIIATAPADGSVVLVGDGDGVVDAAAAGLVDGRSLVLYAGALDDTQVAAALATDAHLIVTDSNRRRIETWFYAIRDVRGPTERAGETLHEPSGHDARLEVFPDAIDDDRSVAEHLGGAMTASASGGAARPEDRAAAAFDDDLGTAWRVGGPDPTGHRVGVELDEDVVVDHLVLVQPQDGPRDRSIQRVRLHLDGESVDVDLGAASLTPEGQRIELGERTVSRIEVEIVAVDHPGFDPALANAVGFAEIRVPGVDLHETVRVPRRWVDRVGPGSHELGLDIVLSRMRYDPLATGRTDLERRMDRRFELPTARSFGVSVTARLNPEADDEVLDALAVPSGTLRATASSRLTGDIGSRAAAAVDGDPTTAWIPAPGHQVGEWIELDLGEPTDVAGLSLVVRADDRHSVPTSLHIVADGTDLGAVPTQWSGLAADGVHEVEFDLASLAGEPVVATTLRIVVDAVDRRASPPGEASVMATLPVAIAEISVPGVPVATGSPGSIESGCRDDLLAVAGEPLAVRVSGEIDGPRRDLVVEPCGGPLILDASSHRLVAAPGHRTGIDIDRVVLSSGPGGDATGLGVRGTPTDHGPPVLDAGLGRTSGHLEVDAGDAPFWVVLNQSLNDGWTLRADGAEVGPRTLVNGYANAWLVDPTGPGPVRVDLRWTPQRVVWLAMVVSVVAAALAVTVVVRTERWIGADIAAPERGLTLSGPLRAPGPVVGVATVVGAATALVARPSVGVAAALVVVATCRWPLTRLVVAVVAPATLVVSYALERPSFGWMALGLVVATSLGRPAVVWAIGVIARRRR